MPTADFFARLGLFVEPHFLDDRTCSELRSAIRSSAQEDAWVVPDGAASEITNNRVRRTKEARLPPETTASIRAGFASLKPPLERHYNLQLTDCQRPQVLIYREGDFFRPHDDSADEPNAPEYVRQRKLSVVMFVNGEGSADTPDTYSGGALTFYGLIAEPQWKDYGFPLVGEAGLVIAFRSHIVHEVTPVTRGERYTIVTWFY